MEPPWSFERLKEMCGKRCSLFFYDQGCRGTSSPCEPGTLPRDAISCRRRCRFTLLLQAIIYPSVLPWSYMSSSAV